MKGIIKGSVFSCILIMIFTSIFAVISMFITVESPIFKSLLWGLITFSVFAGCLPVAKSADSSKFVKAILSAVITLIILTITTSILNKSISLSGEFYVLLLLGLTGGLLGALAGLKKA